MRRYIALYACVSILMMADHSQAQALACSERFPIDKKPLEYAKCLESAMASLQALVELYRDRQTRFDALMREEIQKEIMLEVYGPPKQVTRFPAKILKTISYWNGGNSHGDRPCKDTELKQPQDTVQIGGKGEVLYRQFNSLVPNSKLDIILDGKKIGTVPMPSDYAQRAVACRVSGDCNSTGEYCVSVERPAGCFVNRQWFDWYARHAHAMQIAISDDFVCADSTPQGPAPNVGATGKAGQK